MRSVLLYGCPVWGSGLLDDWGQIDRDCTGALGVFYRSCLRSLLGVSRDLRTEILFVLSARVPLRILVQKSLL